MDTQFDGSARRVRGRQKTSMNNLIARVERYRSIAGTLLSRKSRTGAYAKGWLAGIDGLQFVAPIQFAESWTTGFGDGRWFRERLAGNGRAEPTP